MNDLDLIVTENSSGDVYTGNPANFVNGFSTPGGATDSVNNTECVFIQNPGGTYDIDVVAASITTDARTFVVGTPWQDYALVVDNAQVPSAEPVGVAAVVDRSSSMVWSGYDGRTAQASSQFVSMLNIDDTVGVVSFGDDARTEYPTGAATSVGSIGSSTDRDAAAGAAAGITFGGNTAMGEGIERAGLLLSSVTTTKAIVLLSDGYDNGSLGAETAAAALPSDVPIYSCAMGPASDQPLLDTLASATTGRYYFMPTIDDLFEIYNWIRGRVTGTGVIANESSAASRSFVPAFVDGCSQRASFGVCWADQSVAYTHRPLERAGEVAVRLRAPSGKLLSPTSSLVRVDAGKGYVVFDVDQPAPGLWKVEVETRRSGHLPYTVGGFVESEIDLDLALGTTAPTLPGRPIDITATARRGDTVIEAVRGRACVSAPQGGLTGTLRDIQPRLTRRTRALSGDRIPDHLVDWFNALKQVAKDEPSRLEQRERCVDLTVRDGGPVTPIDRFRDVRLGLRSTVRVADLLGDPVRDLAGARPAHGAGILTARYRDTKEEGNYNIRVTVTGSSPVCGRFVRHDFGTVRVGRPGGIFER